jgi:hypothetical protein
MADTDIQATSQIATQAPAPSRQGEPCEECGSPLAADQRYCLNCGRRRGGPRVDYRHYMGGGVGSGSGEPPAPQPRQPSAGDEPPKPQRDYAPLAAVGGIAVLGLMLLVGVLIGKGNNDNTAATPPPVIRVPATGGESGTPEGSGSSKGSSKSGLGGGAKKAKTGTPGGGGGTGKAPKASTGELEEHSSASGESYEKQSESLPNEIATPGKPPPIDKSTAPGGGEGGAEVIK